MRKHKNRRSISLLLLISVCFIILLGCSVPEATRDATTIESAKNEFVPSYTLGTHDIDILYYSAFISDDYDHTILEPLFPDPGEWKFGLGSSGTSISVYTGLITRDGPCYVSPNLEYSRTTHGSTHFQFGVYAGEWDQFWPFPWTEDSASVSRYTFA
ncbi:MAG: hypothetical protein AM324_014405, partial [Candidatus Thorarchaeota archaeon SMTZ1-83]